MKKLTLLILSLLLMIPTSSYANRNVRLFMYGDFLRCDVPPIIDNNRVLVPLRIISENMGGNVQWIPSEQKIRIKVFSLATRDDQFIELKINSKKVNVRNSIENKVYTMDVAPKIVNSRTMVPIRFISELMKEIVEWDDENSTVAIGNTYRPLHDKKTITLKKGAKTCNVKSFMFGKSRMISVKDFTKAMGWTYAVDSFNYNFGSNGIGLILTEPSTGKKITFHGRGIQVDGIYLQPEGEEFPYLSLDDDYYIPLNDLVTGLHWKAQNLDGGNVVTLSDNTEDTTYTLFYLYSDNKDNTKRVQSRENTILYKNNHFIVMPMNRTIQDFLDEKDALNMQGISSDRTGEADLCGMNIFNLNPRTKEISASIGE